MQSMIAVCSLPINMSHGSMIAACCLPITINEPSNKINDGWCSSTPVAASKIKLMVMTERNTHRIKPRSSQDQAKIAKGLRYENEGK